VRHHGLSASGSRKELAMALLIIILLLIGVVVAGDLWAYRTTR
jgi:hypothetical protein